jgi:predicted Rossmann-fold nucleotide-binding protein
MMQNRKHRRGEVESAEELQRRIDAKEELRELVLQGVDLARVRGLERVDLEGVICLGCHFAGPEQQQLVRRRGAAVFPRFERLPYQPFRGSLYSVEELMAGYDEGGYTATTDFKIYAHAHKERRHPGGIAIREALAQRVHDHAIDDALAELIRDREPRGVVGVMGGHGTPRSDPFYRKVVHACWLLTRKRYLVVTGGGPGVMEAGNLGAWLAGHPDQGVIDEVVALLAVADTMSGGHPEGTPGYLEAIRTYIRVAREVVERFGKDRPPGVSLAVPTWFYGHEPSNLFSTAVAKYFDNSIREEGLLAIAKAGVIYAPGAAGTMQEIFQDLCQNHYGTYGARSPMVLLGSRRYAKEHELIMQFVYSRKKTDLYGDLIALLDEPEQVVAFIESHPPRPVPERKPLYELV